jgi:hypothetical protein
MCVFQMNQTPEQQFIEYCDINFGKAGTPDSTGRTFTQFERFATYWEIFKVAYGAAWNAGADHGYLLGANDEFDHGYRKGQQDMQIELDQSCRDAYQEGLFAGSQQYSIYD